MANINITIFWKVTSLVHRHDCSGVTCCLCLEAKESHDKFCFNFGASSQTEEPDFFLLWIYVVRTNKFNHLLSFLLV